MTTTSADSEKVTVLDIIMWVLCFILGWMLGAIW